MKPGFSVHLTPININPYPDYDFSRSPSVSPPSSPFIYRRALSPILEAQLRAACAALVQDDGEYRAPPSARRQYPVDRAEHSRRIENTRPDAGYSGTRRTQHTEPAWERTAGQSARDASHRQRSEPRKHGSAAGRPPESLVDASTHHVRQWFQNAAAERDAERRTHQLSSSQHGHDDRKYSKQQSSYERPATASLSIAGRSDDTYSSSSYTRSTATTNQHGLSTGRTSATTMSRTSDYPSRDLLGNEKTSIAAEPTTTGWLRQELAKRRGRTSGTEAPAQPMPGRSKSLSRKGKSIGAELKSYLRPQTSSSQPGLSRRSSSSTIGANGRGRSQSLHVWKGWGRHGRSLTDLSTTQHSDEAGGSRGHRSDLNLNRELPPLPPVSSWKDERRPQEVPITEAMLHEMHRNHDYTNNKQKDKSKGLDGKRKSRAEMNMNAPHHDFDELMSAMQTERDSRLINTWGHATKISDDGSLTSPSVNMSIETGHTIHRNFSRKISTETGSSIPGRPYPRVLDLQAQQSTREKPLKGLRRVFSNLFTSSKASKFQEQRALRMERENFRTGIIIHDEAASAPIVRY